MSRVLVAADEEDFAHLGAREIAGCLAAGQRDNEVASVALSGGSTPRSVYLQLASPEHRSSLDWERVEFFWSDERCVEPQDPASNYRLARETLLEPLRIPPARVHRIHGELPPAVAAARYEAELRGVVRGRPPRLDLVLLGLGLDGHTASLFPGAPGGSADRLVIAVEAPAHPPERVSMSLRLLNASRQVLFLVAGEAKRALVARILGGQAPQLPAAQVRPESGRLVWLLDAQAASGLKSG